MRSVLPKEIILADRLGGWKAWIWTGASREDLGCFNTRENVEQPAGRNMGERGLKCWGCQSFYGSSALMTYKPPVSCRSGQVAVNLQYGFREAKPCSNYC